MKCIVGLGNPGRKYTYTRHNAGFLVLSEFAKEYDLEFREHGFSDVAVLDPRRLCAGETVVFVRPGTFMNNSGKAVHSVLADYPLSPSDIVVVHDDMDLPFGKVRIKRKGSSGGHRGIESICLHLGTSEFARIKVGIGRPAPGIDPVDYVLQRFSDDEMEHLPRILSLAKEAALGVVEKGIDWAMGEFNGRDVPIDSEED